jgi:hypothetical protein
LSQLCGPAVEKLYIFKSWYFIVKNPCPCCVKCRKQCLSSSSMTQNITLLICVVFGDSGINFPRPIKLVINLWLKDNASVLFYIHIHTVHCTYLHRTAFTDVRVGLGDKYTKTQWVAYVFLVPVYIYYYPILSWFKINIVSNFPSESNFHRSDCAAEEFSELSF